MVQRCVRRASPCVEALEDRRLLAPLPITVTTAADVINPADGVVSLREAITTANLNSVADVIRFSIPSKPAAPSIALTSPLPDVKFPVLIDGATQGTIFSTHLVELNGSGAGAGANGLVLAGDHITVRGLVINRFVSSLSSGGNGIVIKGTSDTVLGCRIGTDVDGSSALPNAADGVLISGTGNTVGGTTAAARNLLSGNGKNGIEMTGSSNRVLGNFIGTDVTGSLPLGNAVNGVAQFGGANNAIGGPAHGSRNLISGNRDSGVFYESGQTGNRVQGNFIGTDFTGMAPLGNAVNGVRVLSGDNLLIGGVASAERNVISANGSPSNDPFANDGIYIEGPVDETAPATGNLVLGNTIGLDVTGSFPLGNFNRGVELHNAAGTHVGGAMAGDGNVISGNKGAGVVIDFLLGGGNFVQGNFIGTDANGTQAIGNSSGVNVATDNNTIGGTTALARNVISGNLGTGLALADVKGTVVQGNFIGVDAGGSDALANGGDGIIILGFTQSNSIGGTVPGAGNVVAFNGGTGVVVGNSATDLSLGNAILSNSIHDNTKLGIDLADDGVTPNNGSGHAGPNHFQNFPTLTSAVNSNGTMTIVGSLTSTPNTAFTLQFFANSAADASGFGEGETLVSTLTQTTNGNGTAAFQVTVTPAVTVGQFISATAFNRTTHESSEFSQDVPVVAAPVGAAFSAVLPTPRSTPVSVLDLIFSEKVTGLDLHDVRLTRNGSALALAGASLTALSDHSWRLGGLSKLTGAAGDYRLTLTAAGSGIRSQAGQALLKDATVVWHEQLFADAFNRADSATLGAGWTESFGSLAIHTKSLRVGCATAIASVASVQIADVSVQARISVAKTGNQSAGLLARYAGSGDQNYYWGAVVGTNGVFTAQIWRNVNGVSRRLFSHRIATGTGTLRFVVSGKSLQLFMNGVRVGLATDGSLTKPGRVGVRGSAAATFDDFLADTAPQAG